MSLPRDLVDSEPGLGDDCVLHGFRGSVAHGTYEASSTDKDTMAICVPPLDTHYLGLREYGSRGTKEIKHAPWDVVIYECRKAVKLLASGNPNVFTLLWLPENLYVKVTDAGRLLLDERDTFVGRQVFYPYIGMARDQFHKMDHFEKHGYMGEKRKALVDEFSYDTKNASHLIRLLRTLTEFLSTGHLQADRGGIDATELLDIKHGEWTLERVKTEADRLFNRAEDAFDRSTLPLKPDPGRVNDLCARVIRARHGL